MISGLAISLDWIFLLLPNRNGFEQTQVNVMKGTRKLLRCCPINKNQQTHKRTQPWHHQYQTCMIGWQHSDSLSTTASLILVFLNEESTQAFPPDKWFRIYHCLAGGVEQLLDFTSVYFLIYKM